MPCPQPACNIRTRSTMAYSAQVGSAVGDLDFLSHTKRTHLAYAHTDCEVIAVHRGTWDLWCRQDDLADLFLEPSIEQRLWMFLFGSVINDRGGFEGSVAQAKNNFRI